MSIIPTKQIDGDAAIGRNVNVGGNATVRGSVTAGHNLRVEGWLDAPNIKGAQKGMFSSEASLKEAYPQPRPGWWALVGAGFPAKVYLSYGGQWQDSGHTVDSLKVDAPYLEAAFQELRKDVDDLSGSVDDVRKDVDNISKVASSALTASADALHSAQEAGKRADEASQSASTLSENMDTLEQRLETVESRLKKDAAVLRFSHTVEAAEYKRTSLTGNYTVVYDTVSKLFLGCRKAMSRIVADAEYFLGAHVEAYNDMTELHAREDMLYLDGQERLYCFDGEGLKCLNGNQAAVVMSQAEYDSMEPQTDTIYYITE